MVQWIWHKFANKMLVKLTISYSTYINNHNIINNNNNKMKSAPNSFSVFRFDLLGCSEHIDECRQRRAQRRRMNQLEIEAGIDQCFSTDVPMLWTTDKFRLNHGFRLDHLKMIFFGSMSTTFKFSVIFRHFWKLSRALNITTITKLSMYKSITCFICSI